jgi:hypothetical protein
MDRSNPVTKQELIGALRYWRGNVSQAAKLTLKISREAVYEKLKMWNLDPADFREDFRSVTFSGDGLQVDTNEVDMSSSVGEMRGEKVQQFGATATFQSVMNRVGGAVETMVDVAMEVGGQMKRRTPVQHPKLPPPIVDRIQDFRLRRQALTGIETNNSEVDIEFHLACFSGWAEEELARLSNKDAK